MNKLRIYVSSLSDYNAGVLHGRWIDAIQPSENVREEIKEMLAESKQEIAEDFAIHDTEGFGSIPISEYDDIENVCKIAEYISNSEYSTDLISAVYNHLGTCTIENVIDFLTDNYAGCYESLYDYAYEYCENCDYLNSVPKQFRYYIDFEKYAKDLEIGGDIFTIETRYNEIHVFYNN
jgi:antirestriction protein